MKNIIKTVTIIIFATLSCKAQSPIISLAQDDNNDWTEDNTYVKDLDNVFNPYFGTWKWEDTSTNTSFTIEFFKLEMVHYAGSYYADLLIGKYRFVKDNVELFNSLDMININAYSYKAGSVWSKLMGSYGYISNTIIDFQIYDNIKEKYCKAQIELLPPFQYGFPDNHIITSTGSQLQWRFSLRRAPYVDNEFSMYDYTSYPEFIILTKQ